MHDEHGRDAICACQERIPASAGRRRCGRPAVSRSQAGWRIIRQHRHAQAGVTAFIPCWSMQMSYVPPPPNAAPVHGPVPNHLAWSIISTVLATCLCCPLGLVGIVAIVFSSKVNTLLNQGDIEGARRASANAKTWCWVTTAGMAEYQQMMEQMQG